MSKPRRLRGEGALWENKKRGLWVFEVDLGLQPDGRRVRRTITAKTKPLLQRKIADERARGGGTFRPRAYGTVGDVVTAWLEGDVRPNRAPATYLFYENLWRKHAAPLLRAAPLDRFGPAHVRELYRRLREGGATATTVANVARLMHRALEVAIRSGDYHGANPFARVEKPRVAARREKRSFTQREAAAFLAAVEGTRFEALWVLLLTAGLRIGEALALRWCDVDFAARTIAVTRSLSEADGTLEYRDPKAGSRRTIEFGDLLERALLRRRGKADAEGHDSDLVFCTKAGTEIRRRNVVRSHLRPLLERAGLPSLSPHELRHSMTSIAIASGVPAKSVAARLGHATTRLTEDRYAHVLPGMGKKAANTIERAVAPRARKAK